MKKIKVRRKEQIAIYRVTLLMSFIQENDLYPDFITWLNKKKGEVNETKLHT